MNREERLKQDGVLGEPVLFYGPRSADGEGSNFSPHSIILPHPFTKRWTKYQTGEHRYQAMKATTEEEHDYVNRAFSPGQAKHRGREVLLRPGWGSDYGDYCWYVMFEVVLYKTRQNAAIEQWLRETADRHIYEDSPTDDIWGWRYAQDHRGKNLLGRCWMDVRSLLWSSVG